MGAKPSRAQVVATCVWLYPDPGTWARAQVSRRWAPFAGDVTSGRVSNRMPRAELGREMALAAKLRLFWRGALGKWVVVTLCDAVKHVFLFFDCLPLAVARSNPWVLNQ